MLLLIQQLFLISFFFESIRSEKILLPKSLLNNQTLSSVYLCHLYQLNNSNEYFLKNYEIINDKNIDNIHHLLLYECSINEKLIYSGLCGKYNLYLMPKLVYQHCQTRILIAWAKGGQLKYIYPNQTGLKINSYTQFLLEIHFEPFIPYNYSIGINLKFYSNNQKPKYEIGVLTIGTLAKSTLYLPPYLDLIYFPTYCFNDCLKLYFKNYTEINIFSILIHAHKYAKRIILQDKYSQRLIDKNPFEYHKQDMIFFNKTYPKLNLTNELSLICLYSTKTNLSQPILGGYNSNNEMCQAFIYYYPKISLFSLCLSLPIYSKNIFQNIKFNWTKKQSLFIKNKLELNKNHLSMCGDNIFLNNTNQTIFHMKIYQRSIENKIKTKYYFYSSTFYIFIIFIFFLFYYLIRQKLILTFFF